MSEIINCFFHCIEPTDEGYTYHFAVPTNNGITIRKITVGAVETVPVFQTTPLPRELKQQGQNIWNWMKDQTTTKIVLK